MSRLSPLDVFEDNIADADRLIGLTRVLLNTRSRKMRRELRDSFGRMMRLPRRTWQDLDCVESADVFVLLKPDGAAERAHFDEPELRPLLRQAVVAISAAVESYVAEKAASLVSEALRSDPVPPRLAQMAVKFEDVLWVEKNYQRRGWGHRQLIKEHLISEASPDPGQIGKVFSTVGQSGLWAKVDKQRRVAKGTSETQARALAERRNRIAHAADRAGGGRAQLTLSEVESFYDNAKSIVEAMDSVI